MISLLFGFQLVVASASAGDVDGAARCEAVFVGPVISCSLKETWSATGTGKNEEAATKNALVRLRSAVDAGAKARSEHAIGSSADWLAAKEGIACGSVAAANATVHCFPDDTLMEKAECFTAFSSTKCYRSGVVETKGKRWKAMESGREKICREVDAWLVSKRVSEQQRFECKAKCLQEVKVSCP